MSIIIPKGYKPLLDKRMTERAIKFVKDTFERELASELRLSRVTSPRFVKANSGINDDLNGVERPVRFNVGNMDEMGMEIVQSLAKWKRMALADHGFAPGTGLYTDMDAIRPDDDIDNIHSIYVDQWDWERVITEDERNLDFLKRIVNGIYDVIRRTAFLVAENYPACAQDLPEHIRFIESEEARAMYPDL
ncbi:MAG: aspartate--ammonia ligase, partial [Spirochaetales bacterium]|nr:aspartate--ammonia ligase [Spirochaetales bacterium]